MRSQVVLDDFQLVARCRERYESGYDTRLAAVRERAFRDGLALADFVDALKIGLHRDGPVATVYLCLHVFPAAIERGVDVAARRSRAVARARGQHQRTKRDG